MNVREKLIEIVKKAAYSSLPSNTEDFHLNMFVTNLLSHGVTVQEHGYWETVVEVRDNTVCGNGVKIEYKRCSCCKNPSKFFEDDFCGHCGAKLDLPQPPKGE